MGGVLIPGVELDMTRLKVYHLAVDGLGPNSGMTQASIAKELGMTKSNVKYYLDEFLIAGYISRPKKRTKNILYSRGPNANILDEATVQFKVLNDGGTVNVLTKSPPQSSNLELSDSGKLKAEVSVPISRTHLEGRIGFPVLKVGDLTEIKVKHKDPNTGKENEVVIPLFPKSPYLDHHNVIAYKCELVSSGTLIAKLQYHEGHAGGSIDPTSMILWVFPAEIPMVVSELDDAPQYFIDKAQGIVNLLTKWGGWKIGPADLTGTLHYAVTDTPILDLIPEDIRNIKSSDGVDWVDGSDKAYGPREWESRSADRAKIAMQLTKEVKDLKNGAKASVDRVVHVEARLDRVEHLMERIEKILERGASIESKITERLTADTAEKVLASTEKPESASEAKMDPDNRMYG